MPLPRVAVSVTVAIPAGPRRARGILAPVIGTTTGVTITTTAVLPTSAGTVRAPTPIVPAAAGAGSATVAVPAAAATVATTATAAPAAGAAAATGTSPTARSASTALASAAASTVASCVCNARLAGPEGQMKLGKKWDDQDRQDQDRKTSQQLPHGVFLLGIFPLIHSHCGTGT